MATASPFLGRSAELAAVCDLLEAARSGAGDALIVEGEAGIGKTRLLDEACAVAARLGFRVCRGATDELERDRPFGSLADALDLKPGTPDADRAEIARIALAEEEEESGDSQPADVGFRIVEAVVALIERLARANPVFLVLDDFHWADASTARAVRAVVRAVRQLPVALVLSMRPFPRGAELGRVLDDVRVSSGRHLRLSGLGETDVAALAEAMVGAHPGPRLLNHIAGAAGNPLFVIELARSLLDEGVLRIVDDKAEMDDDSFPPSLRRSILRRVAFLSDPTLEVLKVATVLGRRFPVTLLAAVMGRSAVDLLRLLEQALEAGVLEEVGDEIAFRHDVIRDAIYEEIPLPLRRSLHREAARVLASLGAPLPQVAEQFLLGAAPGDGEAREWLSRAGRQAASRSPATAVKLLQRALDLTPFDSPEGYALASDLAPLLIQIGRPEDAEHLTREVLIAGPPPGVEVSLRRALGEVLWTQGWLEPAIGELEAAADVGGAPSGERRGARALAAYLRLFVGQPDVAAAEADRVRAEAAGAGDDFATCLSLQTLALVAEAEARLPAAIELATAAVTTASRSVSPRVGHLHPHLSLGFVLLDADRLDDAETVLQEGRRRAERRGTVLWLPLYQGALAMRRAVAGHWDDTLAETEVGLRLCDEVGTRLFASFLHGLGAWVAFHRGRLDAAQAGLEAAIEEFIAAATPAWQAQAGQSVRAAGAHWPLEWGLWLQALLTEARGGADEAFASLDDAWAVAAPLRYFLGYRVFAPDLVRLAVAAGNRSLASTVTEEVEQGSERSRTASARGAALRCRGLLDDDPSVLLAAVEAYRTTPCRTELAFTLEDAGASLGRAGRPGESVPLVEEAIEFYESVEADRAMARADALLRSFGVRRRRTSAARRPSSGWDSLTPTERTVVRLVAEGLTNRQIGDQLFVSRRTVETHLAHVFAKLGMSSRAQLAAEASRRT